jgi:hypothetical protein
MTTRPLCTLLAALPLCTLSAMLALPVAASAQQPWPGSQVQLAQRASPSAAPDVSEDDELSPRQMQSQPAGQPAARRPRPTTQVSAPAQGAPRGGGHTIACSGVFAHDSNHLKLAMAFEARNLTFTQVDGPDNTKLNASVVFPNDPKRRLEVLWENDATRSATSLIVIGGQSQWVGPKGLHVGMPLAALEKANGKPFKLAGQDQPNGGSVLDWDGGAMDSLPGGCKVGIRLAADPKAGDAGRTAFVGKELVSNDAALKPAKLGIVEIILGY